MTTVAIPFVRVDASQNPNVSVPLGTDPAEPYFKSMIVAFASLRRWNPDVALEFISNAPPPDKYAAHFNGLGVKHRLVPFRHRPPEGFASRFVASLYMLDAVEALETTTLIIDPDVLCIDRIDRLVQESAGRAGALQMNFPPEEDINGINRIEAGRLHALLGEPADAPEHFGGEVYFIPAEHKHSLVGRNERAWELALERHAAGLSKFVTEEHILSYSLRGVPLHSLNHDIRRVWTAHRYRKVDGREDSLTLWHLPAEKDRGFMTLFPDALNQSSWFWQGSRSEFVDKAGRAMGFHHRSLVRTAKDWAGFWIRLLQDKIPERSKVRY